MTDYIERSVAIARKIKLECEGLCPGMDFVEFRKMLANLPAADVVPVVRCKDCKYYRYGKHFTDIKFCQRLPYYAEKGGLNTADDDFCSYGERKGCADKHD